MLRISRSLVVFLALVVVLGAPAETGAAPPTQAKGELPLVAWTGKPGPEWAEYDKLVAEDKLVAAAAIAETRWAKLKGGTDSEDRTRALLRLASLRFQDGQHLVALRLLREQTWPHDLLGFTATSLVYVGMLEHYLLLHGWELDRRAEVAASAPGAIETWPLAQFRAEIGRVCQELWAHRAQLGELKQAAVTEYLEANDYPPEIRPTLRDAVTYLIADWVGGRTHPWLVRDDGDNLDVDLDLAQLTGEIPTPTVSLADPLAPRLRKLAYVLDDLEGFHRARGEVEAAFEAKRTRLEVLHSYPLPPAQRGKVRARLQKELGRVQGKPWWSTGMATLADLIMETDEPDRLIRAHDLALRGEQAFPASPGGAYCRQVRQQIEEPELRLTAMAADAPKRRSLGVSYKNLEKLYFRAFPVDVEQRLRAGKEPIDMSESEIFTLLSGKRPQHAWAVDLPATRDHETHQAFVVPPMERPGFYLVVASQREDFARTGNRLQAVVTSISNLAVVVSRVRNALRVQAFSAETGQPLPDVEVLAYQSRRAGDAQTRSRTKALGLTTIPVAGEAGERRVWARKGTDLALADDYWYRESRDKASTRTLIYTDRSIYRPGQSVKLKVVAYRGGSESGDLKVAPHARVKLTLQDGADQKVLDKTLVTNARGSATGELVLPVGRTLGHWSIESSPEGEAQIAVEEYKRASFQAKLLDPKIPLRLGQPTELKGEARYTFGEPVTAGKVRWRITRTLAPPKHWWKTVGQHDRHWLRRFVDDSLVMSGATNLDANGGFTIRFVPKPEDRFAGLDPDTTFGYTVEVDVTDQGGETGSAKRTFHAGRTAVTAELKATTQFLRADQPGQMRVLRRTLDGLPAPGKGAYRIVQIRQPGTARLPADEPRQAADSNPYALPDDGLRPRWGESDADTESILGTFPDGAEQVSGQLIHDDSGEAVVPISSLGAGPWRLKYTTSDDFGGKRELSYDFIVAAAQVSLALPAYLHVENPTVRVGENAHVLVGSGLPDQTLVLDRLRDGNLVKRTLLRSGRDSALIEIPVTAEDRGGFSLALTVIRDHQRLHLTQRIDVPWDNKQLKVEFARFRDVLRPGADETLSVKVTGPAGETTPVGAAEVLAYMYDRSLDALASHVPPNPVSLFSQRAGPTDARTNLGQARGMWLWLWQLGHGSAVEPIRLPHGDRLKLSLGERAFLRRSANIVTGKMKAFAETDKDTTLYKAKPAARQGLYATKPMERQAGLRPMAASVFHDAPPQPRPALASLRSDFSETAFFLPQLLTEADGTVTFQFHVPDAVTAWTAWAHALTDDFKSGSASAQARTVKDLIVRPYLPRFLREGDRAVLKVMVSNASTHDLSGSVSLDIVDPESGQSVLSSFGLTKKEAEYRAFSVKAGGSADLGYAVTTPPRLGPVAFKVTARSGEFSDGELRPLPILPGRIHLTQSRSAMLRDETQRKLDFEDLARTGDPTRVDERMVVTVEAQLFHSLLAALPYLVHYPYECTEQTLNRFLSTSILASLYRQQPAIARLAKQMAGRKTEFETWDRPDANRTMALEETPWLEQARGGAAEKELYPIIDPRAVEATRNRALAKLQDAQLESGAFPWFAGGPPSTAMTLYLLGGLAKATEFKVDVPKNMAISAARYLHSVYNQDIGSETAIVLGYVLSRFPNPSWYGASFTPAEREELLARSFQKWQDLSPYLKGLLALTLKRMGREADARLVWESVLDRARSEPDLGTFWPPEERGWLWYNDPIETQAAAIHTTMEVAPKSDKLDGMVEWLLLNKQSSHWKSTRATAEAIYALTKYLGAKGRLGGKQEIVVTAGQRRERFDFLPDRYRPGGNQMIVVAPDPVTVPVLVDHRTPGFAFASATWHYATDKLPAQGRGDLVQLSRDYFRVDKSSRGSQLVPLRQGARLEVGDEVEARLHVRGRVAMDYVHVRDPRPAGCEPASQLSRHRWDGALALYEEVHDSGTSFFLEHLPPGEHVLSHRMRASVAGTFKISPATAQPMYAPELAAFSAGDVVEVAPQDRTPAGH